MPSLKTLSMLPVRRNAKNFASIAQNLFAQDMLTGITFHPLDQWFPNFFGSRTICKNLVVREEQNIDLYWDLRTTSANLVDYQWSEEQTLGTTALDNTSSFPKKADNIFGSVYAFRAHIVQMIIFIHF